MLAIKSLCFLLTLSIFCQIAFCQTSNEMTKTLALKFIAKILFKLHGISEVDMPLHVLENIIIQKIMEQNQNRAFLNSRRERVHDTSKQASSEESDEKI